MTEATSFELQRLAYLIRHSMSGEVFRGVRIEVAARMMTDRLSVYLSADVWGRERARTVELDCPDGRWQHFRAALGLSYRKRKLRFTAHQLFPDLQLPPESEKLGRAFVRLWAEPVKGTDDADDPCALATTMAGADFPGPVNPSA